MQNILKLCAMLFSVNKKNINFNSLFTCLLKTWNFKIFYWNDVWVGSINYLKKLFSKINVIKIENNYNWKIIKKKIFIKIMTGDMFFLKKKFWKKILKK